PEQMSSSRSLTRSQPRSLLSIAKLKIARSRLDRAISRRTRIDHTCLGSRGFFWPTSNPLFQGCRPRPAGRAGIRDPPLYRERLTLEPTERSGVAYVYALDRPLLAHSGRSTQFLDPLRTSRLGKQDSRGPKRRYQR